MRLLLIVFGMTMNLIGAAHATDRSPSTDPVASEIYVATLQLKGLGIDATSETQALAALDSTDSLVQYFAMNLAKLKKDKAAIPALRRVLASHSAIDRITSCEALEAIGDDPGIWMPVCVQILSENDPIPQLAAARLLAKNGDGRGWAVTYAALQGDDSVLTNMACDIIPTFRGVKYLSAKGLLTLDPLATCLGLFSRSTERTQISLLAPISELAQPADIGKLRQLQKAAKSAAVRSRISDVVGRLKTSPKLK
jgi:HEAT repeat protein